MGALTLLITVDTFHITAGQNVIETQCRPCWCDVTGEEAWHGASCWHPFRRGNYGTQGPDSHELEGAVRALQHEYLAVGLAEDSIQSRCCQCVPLVD